MEFVSIDVETANADLSSICQIGIAHYLDGKLIDQWKTYVNPEDDFDAINISIHGITEETVKDSPRFPEIVERICKYLNQRVSVCHTHFDRTAIQQVCEKYQVNPPETTWLDSSLVARRAWEECSHKGYNLVNVCKMIGYDFIQHDALEDAKAAGLVLIAAINKTGANVEEWVKRVKRPSPGQYIERDGNPDGYLFGEVLVFTGSLSIHRHEAADIASKLGCRVEDGVNKGTTLLVVGDQDIRKLHGYAKNNIPRKSDGLSVEIGFSVDSGVTIKAGETKETTLLTEGEKDAQNLQVHEKSSKHRKAEKLISEGQPIRILRESDFLALVKIESM